MNYDVEWLEPRWVLPPHEVRDKAKFEHLVDDMRSHGWIGRPLLVEHIDGSLHKAWTGSHRIAAALESGLEEVPAVVLDEEALEDVSETERWSMLTRDDYGHWDTRSFDDEDLVNLLAESGDEQAARLMVEELDANQEAT